MRTSAAILALFLMTAVAAPDRPNHFKVMRYTPDGSMEVVLQSYAPQRAKASTARNKRCHGAQIRAARHNAILMAFPELKEASCSRRFGAAT